MKQLALLCLLATSAIAQDGEYQLRWSSIMLANNRQSIGIPFFAPGRRYIPLDKLDMHENSVQNFRARVFTYLAERNFEEATAWMEKMTSSYPKEHGFIGESYLSRLHDYPRALQHLQAYDALTASFDDMIGNNPVSYLLGLTYRSLGDHSKAINHFSIGIDSLSLKHGAEWVNYRHFVSRAVSYIATGQAEKALTDLNKAAKNYSRSALVAYHKGRAFQQLNRLAEARAAFQDASFFYKALRAERTGDYQEDNDNPVYEEEIDEALSQLKQSKP
ncbi:tetratricopeptide repeat protein [Spirosoma sp.]|uniref:tetratricopeptide repeat protein n=1 Tax=Spirosoma sp. TaxID=1899569 RepID=UPI00260438BA|nr:tetratricopeptide repeat protein [Spirosoma sp.]MCX6214014.1 tetratricopeptide repeat protein [Spirosoma sp.]